MIVSKTQFFGSKNPKHFSNFFSLQDIAFGIEIKLFIDNKCSEVKKIILMLAVALCVPAYAQNADNSKKTSHEYKEKKCITKTYELEHADFDEIEKELNTIIGHCNIANKATDSENNEHFLKT